MSEEFFPNDTFKESLDDVTFEQAKKLKMLGFDWKCHKRYEYYPKTKNYIIKSAAEYNYNGENVIGSIHCEFYSCPSIPLALKWIRTKVDYGFEYRMGRAYSKLYWYKIPLRIVEEQILNDKFNTYEEAENALLDVLLDILIKDKKQKDEKL